MGDSKARYDRVKEDAKQILGGACAVCGTTEGLEFDHIDPTTKSFSIDGGSRYARARLLDELAKCQLLCGPHHREKTERDLAARREHGSKTMWNRKCRCAVCREGQRIRMAQYRKSKVT